MSSTIVPDDAEVTRTARIWLAADGLARVAIAPQLVQSIGDAETNIATAIRVGNGVKRPILVDISHAEPLAPHVRRLYSGRALFEAFVALALLVRADPVGRMMGNVYFRIAKPQIPIKLFDSEPRAVAWLLKHR